MNKSEFQFEIDNLGEITDDPNDNRKEIPALWQEWLMNEIDGVELLKKPRPMPPGVLGMLVYNTSMVIRTKFFLWQLVKLFIISWVAYQTKLAANSTKASVGVSFLEISRNIKNSFVLLDQNKGQHCIYLSLSTVNILGATFFKMNAANKEQIWKKHTEINSECEVRSCVYFNDGCTLIRSEFDSVLIQLKERKVVKELDNKKWKIIV